MVQLKTIVAGAVLSLGILAGAAARARNAPEPLAVGRSRQLFVDDSVIGESVKVSRIFHQAVKSERNPVLVAEKPWEGTMVDVGTVLYDADEKLFKMWYGALEMKYQAPAPPYSRYDNLLRAANYSERFLPCYATSRDGVRWERPSLGLVEYNGSKDNNLLKADRRMEYFLGSIYKDIRETNRDRRYKSVGYWNDKAGNIGVGATFSPDGLRW